MNSFKEICEKAEKFIYRNARPIELALWQYHFENGSAENVLKALSAYQNADGGFGHALEADSFNPDSCPVQTWRAAVILEDIGFENSSHPIIKGMFRYLDSGADFSEEHKQWLNTVKSNDNYPHAIWWSYSDKEEAFSYNPTAALAGFILRFADRSTPLYNKAEAIAKQAYHWLKAHTPVGDSHFVGCFVTLYNYLSEIGINIIDMEEFAEILKKEVNANICPDTEKWKTEYVCKPSAFISDKNSIFYEENRELVEAECRIIAETQLSDGSFTVPWQWYNEYKEFLLAENWWKSVLIIEKLSFLKEFS